MIGATCTIADHVATNDHVYSKHVVKTEGLKKQPFEGDRTTRAVPSCGTPLKQRTRARMQLALLMDGPHPLIIKTNIFKEINVSFLSAPCGAPRAIGL